ncbi:MAG: MFS transporter [Patescibacteria group bacterium]
MLFKKESWENYFNLRKINKVIRFLTISDILIVSGLGLVAPIFAVFITESIKGGTLEVIGIASAVYLLTKSLGQIPIASIIDKSKGKKDDFWAMFIGSVIFSIVPLFYLVISSPIELYIVQFFYGLSAAIIFPSWMAIFTRHIDKKHEAIEWGVYQTLADLGSAGAALLGGFLAFRFGFTSLFIIVSITCFIGSMFLVVIYKQMKTGNILFRN